MVVEFILDNHLHTGKINPSKNLPNYRGMNIYPIHFDSASPITSLTAQMAVLGLTINDAVAECTLLSELLDGPNGLSSMQVNQFYSLLSLIETLGGVKVELLQQWRNKLQIKSERNINILRK